MQALGADPLNEIEDVKSARAARRIIEVPTRGSIQQKLWRPVHIFLTSIKDAFDEKRISGDEKARLKAGWEEVKQKLHGVGKEKVEDTMQPRANIDLPADCLSIVLDESKFTTSERRFVQQLREAILQMQINLEGSSMVQLIVTLYSGFP